MAWRRSGDKPLSGPMMVRLPTHICVTRPQWINTSRPCDTYLHRSPRGYIHYSICIPSLLNNYHQFSNIRRTLAGNKIVDHSDVVRALPVSAAPTTSSFSILTPGINWLGKDNCKMRWETFKFWDLVQLILEILQYACLSYLCRPNKTRSTKHRRLPRYGWCMKKLPMTMR